MIDHGIPRHGYEIKDADGVLFDVVTSCTQATLLGKAVGMGYFATGHRGIDSEIFVEVRGKLLKARVAKMPFA